MLLFSAPAWSAARRLACPSWLQYSIHACTMLQTASYSRPARPPPIDPSHLPMVRAPAYCLPPPTRACRWRSLDAPTLVNLPCTTGSWAAVTHWCAHTRHTFTQLHEPPASGVEHPTQPRHT